jgi:hypothetical protein
MWNREEWLKGLKVGDVICIEGPYGWPDNWHPVKITRITPAGKITVMLSGGAVTVFNIRGEHRVGTGMGGHTSRLGPITDEMRIERRRKNLVAKVKGFDLDKFSIESIKNIYDMMTHNYPVVDKTEQEG